VLINPAGLIFAGQRIDSPTPAWQMPQGGIDKGEKPAAAALRELWEETGVTPIWSPRFVAKMKGWVTYDLPPELLGKVWGGKYRGSGRSGSCSALTAPTTSIRIDTDHPERAGCSFRPGSTRRTATPACGAKRAQVAADVLGVQHPADQMRGARGIWASVSASASPPPGCARRPATARQCRRPGRPADPAQALHPGGPFGAGDGRLAGGLAEAQMPQRGMSAAPALSIWCGPGRLGSGRSRSPFSS
jgi:hypothetical protein